MKREEGCASSLRHSGKLRGNDVFFVPAGAELRADGQGRVLHHRGDNLLSKGQIQQQSAAVSVAGDLSGWTAAIDVKTKEAVPQLLRDHPGRHAHGDGVAAKELDPQEAFLGTGTA